MPIEFRLTSAGDFIGDKSTSKKVLNFGTHRVKSLRETEVLAVNEARKVGVTRLSNLTELDRVGIPVMSAMCPLAEKGNITVLGGKGVTLQAARVSACMEAIERYCGERNGRKGFFATQRDASKKISTLDPIELAISRKKMICQEQQLEWLVTRELFTDAETAVPACFLLHPYLSEERLCLSSTNGLASGNSLPEALLHALYEIIERDATSFAELMVGVHKVAHDSIPSESLHFMKAFEKAGIDARIYYFDSPTVAHVFHVLLDDRVDECPLLINGGYGCHLDPGVALSRAITEAALSRATVIAGNREDLTDNKLRLTLGYDRIKNIFKEWFDTSKMPLKIFSSLQDTSTNSISQDIEVLLESLSLSGFGKVFALDLGLPGMTFDVVRAVIPGMEQYHLDRDRVGPRLKNYLKDEVNV